VTEPNKREQDLFKEKLLCHECEQSFSKLEKYFAEVIFYPFVNEDKQIFEYDERLKKFIISVQWRMGIAEWRGKERPSFAKRIFLKKFINSARLYLLEKVEDISYEQHLIFFGEISSMPQDQVPPRFHQYLLRSVDATLVSDVKKRIVPKTIYNFIKLPHMAFVSFIKPKSNSKWVGTRIENVGILDAKQEIRDGSFGRFLIDRARMVNDVFKSGISLSQIEKITRSATKDLSKFAKSKTFDAYKADKKIGSKYD